MITEYFTKEICIMRLTYHGIQHEDDNDTGYFRLGILRLPHWLTTFDISKAQESEQGGHPEWTQKDFEILSSISMALSDWLEKAWGVRGL